MLILPEVGDEVMVAFEFGDIRRGYILGGVYNGKDQPFDKLGTGLINSGAAARRGFASLKGHKLAFEDNDSGDNGIHLITGDTNFELYLDQKNTIITIDSKSGKVKIHGAQDIEIKSDANVTIEATANLTLKGTGGVSIESPAQTEVKGATLALEGSGMASLKGGIVKIN